MKQRYLPLVFLFFITANLNLITNPPQYSDYEFPDKLNFLTGNRRKKVKKKQMTLQKKLQRHE